MNTLNALNAGPDPHQPKTPSPPPETSGLEASAPAFPQPAAASEPGLRETTLARLGQAVVQPTALIQLAGMKKPEADPLIKILQREPVLCSRLLGVMNSAQFGLRHQVSSVDRAVRLLGAEHTLSLALAYGIRTVYDQLKLPPEIQRDLWLNNLRKAHAARFAALQICPYQVEQAFIVGLIQDIALPSMVALDPGFYQQRVFGTDSTNDWLDLERERFGIDHARASAVLLEGWSVPDRLTAGVADHHEMPGGEAADSSDQAGESGALSAGEDGLARLPGFIAGLLPHQGPSPSPHQRQWLDAVHAKFLFESYNTPDDFLNQVHHEVALLTGGEPTTPAPGEADAVRAALDASLDQTTAMVSRLYRLENALGRKHENLTHLRMEAFTDELTQILNRRGFFRLSKRRLEEAVASDSPACCIMLDLDDFKPINDQHGHPAGDQFLRGLASMMRQNLDRTDLVGRLGGDEFAVFITGVNLDEAQAIARRLCESCLGARLPVREGAEAIVRFSLGVVHCEHPAQGVTIEDLVCAADDAMYHQKRRGKGGWSLAQYPSA